MTGTFDARVAALPPHNQVSITALLEFFEWKNSLPSYRRGRRDHNREFGERLRAVRQSLRQSEEAAAVAAGVALPTYQRYEAGIIGRWPAAKITGYCETWNVSYDYLIAGEGTMFSRGGPPELEPTELQSPPMASTARGPRGPYKVRGVAEIERALREARRNLDRGGAPLLPASNVINWQTARERAPKGGAK